MNNFCESLREKCPITGKHGPGKTPYLDTFHAVNSFRNENKFTQMFISFTCNPFLINTLLKDNFCLRMKWRV